MNDISLKDFLSNIHFFYFARLLDYMDETHLPIRQKANWEIGNIQVHHSGLGIEFGCFLATNL